MRARILRILGLFVAIVFMGSGSTRSVADDAIQIINSAWEWPDQGLGLWDPNGDTTGGAIAREMVGAGGTLYVVGSFNYAGGVEAQNIASWNGRTWSAVGDLFPSSTVHTVLVMEHALYIGGSFNKVGNLQVNGIAQWDGTTWSALGSGTGWGVLALEVWNDSTGSALYAGGGFQQRLKKWDGKTWTVVGGGCNSTVADLTVFDDGGGPALIVAGPYACGGAAGPIMKWDGQVWTSLGFNLTNGGSIDAVAGFDDGSGPMLYVGGRFTEVNNLPAVNLARWDGKAWSAVGGGLETWEEIIQLRVLDDGSGPALYAVSAGVIQKWDGKVWTRYVPDAGANTCVELFPGQDGKPTLHVGGEISFFEGDPPQRIRKNIARWVAPPAPGCKSADFDGNGVIDQADLGILLAAYNCPGPDCKGDADGDGDVDQADLGILLANFGQKCG